MHVGAGSTIGLLGLTVDWRRPRDERAFDDLRLAIRPIAITIATWVIKPHPIELAWTGGRWHNTNVRVPLTCMLNHSGGGGGNGSRYSVRPKSRLGNSYSIADAESGRLHWLRCRTSLLVKDGAHADGQYRENCEQKKSSHGH